MNKIASTSLAVLMSTFAGAACAADYEKAVSESVTA